MWHVRLERLQVPIALYACDGSLYACDGSLYACDGSLYACDGSSLARRDLQRGCVEVCKN
jgi:hypothetical protein